jgi:hypothetical protein
MVTVTRINKILLKTCASLLAVIPLGMLVIALQPHLYPSKQQVVALALCPTRWMFFGPFSPLLHCCKRRVYGHPGAFATSSVTASLPSQNSWYRAAACGGVPVQTFDDALKRLGCCRVGHGKCIAWLANVPSDGSNATIFAAINFFCAAHLSSRKTFGSENKMQKCRRALSEEWKCRDIGELFLLRRSYNVCSVVMSWERFIC